MVGILGISQIRSGGDTRYLSDQERWGYYVSLRSGAVRILGISQIRSGGDTGYLSDQVL